MNDVMHMSVRKLARFGLTTADADRLATFFEHAFGFRRLAMERVSGADFERLMEVEGGARRITLGLGDEVVELLQFDHCGELYPALASASDLIFQHFAIVVTNIEQAMQRLEAVGGWRAISRDGPQQLPATSGGVAAFKFRDPDGHPLELLAFLEGNIPSHWKERSGTGLCLGIDHSAISVSDSGRSIAFYEELGLRVSARSFNQGSTQGRLDGLHQPRVEVIALSPRDATPHIELLCYRPATRGHGIGVRNNDIAAARLVLEADCRELAGSGVVLPQSLSDPDGHHLLIVSPVAGGKLAEASVPDHDNSAAWPS